MKSIITIFFAALLWTGCYTQVRSSGDYWGYTGHHQRERVDVTPDSSQEQPYLDSNNYAEQENSSGGGEYNGDDVYAPYYAPAVSLYGGWGWHRPWLGLGLGYSTWYDPYWDWYYQPAFSPYGCDPYFSFYRPYYGFGLGFYGGFRGYYGGGFGYGGGGRRFSLLENRGRGSVTGGRINGGEGRGGIIAGRSGGSTAIANSGRSNSIMPRNSASQSSVSRANANSPRNNPRLTPQSSGRYSRNYSQGMRANPGYRGGSAPRGYSGGGAYRGGGGRSSGGSRGGGGGGRSGGGSRGGGGRGR